MARSGKAEQGERRNWVSPLAPNATTVAHSAFARAGFSDPTLVLRWEEIAGPETARLARPIRFSQGPNGGVLTLKAEPGAALFLQHETRPLCERINAYLGHPAVARLRFVQGPLAVRPAPPPLRPSPASIPPTDPILKYKGPDGLRAALQDLARARRSRTNMGS
ncbi:MAG: DUF721 domain-containing protein [Alphaproteobacteria bacterium]|nr:DUF721 domain-containing protein [Alphaproteobacteria bacterium]MDE1985355.1 DUF721 domain-containing protein [Alphaproteobacteria bacterium]MDE2265408.1 DUF721 domain-containing protein [Alphaproteobacteria bacterium]